MTRVVRVQGGVDDALRNGIAKIRQELDLPEGFSPEVEQAAEVAARNPRLPGTDMTDLPFVTIDPPDAMDLDQAMYLARDGHGYVVRYAIADVGAFVRPGDPIDVEANRRGETLYGADTKIPLHPTALSESAASLLPGSATPAFVWTMALDDAGDCTDVRVERALVQTAAKLDYETVQRAGPGDDLFDLLRDIGELRIAKEIERGGVDLPMPEQEVVIDGEWTLEFRSMLPVERWNAQISLLTGFSAARMMIDHRIGLLRTLPPPADETVDRLRRSARALKVDWPADVDYPELVRSLNPEHPNEAAMAVACTSLLRGAGYTPFRGNPPDQSEHAALASPYTHCTAPLRRLVDRYTLEICSAICAGDEVPDWVLEKLDGLPATMQESGRRARTYENAIIDLVEATTLQHRIGETFNAVVLELNGDDGRRASVQVEELAVEAIATSDRQVPNLGDEVAVTLAEANPETRTVLFSI